MWHDRELTSVCLADEIVWSAVTVFVVGLNRLRQIAREDARSSLEQQFCEASGAATNLQHRLVPHYIKRSAETPCQSVPRNVCAAVGVELRLAKSGPLQSERGCVIRRVHKARDVSHHGHAAARRTSKD